MLLRVGMWVWLIILVAELVVGPPLAMKVRVCLEANDFRKLINLTLKSQIASRPLFSLVVRASSSKVTKSI